MAGSIVKQPSDSCQAFMRRISARLQMIRRGANPNHAGFLRAVTDRPYSRVPQAVGAVCDRPGTPACFGFAQSLKPRCLACLLFLLLPACRQEMADQPRYEPYEESNF